MVCFDEAMPTIIEDGSTLRITEIWRHEIAVEASMAAAAAAAAVVNTITEKKKGWQRGDDREVFDRLRCCDVANPELDFILVVASKCNLKCFRRVA